MKGLVSYSKNVRKRGFTLIELLVALGIFLIVMVVALTSLLRLSSSNHTAQLSRKTIDNIDFVMDDIIREAHLGKNYHCGPNETTKDNEPRDCKEGNVFFAFTRLDDGQVVRYKRVQEGTIYALEKKVGNATQYTRMTVEGIDIKNLKFYVEGSELNDSKMARVLITLQAELKKGERYITTVNLQTTIAQREQDN
jgi:prepilin-type N-terminal cleavage/methylation domain-containing protein